MDTRDPNVVENYEQDPTDSASDPTPKEECDPNANHPLVALILRYLRTHPHIERYTVLLDIVSGTAEFRITLSKQSERRPQENKYERRR